MKLFSKFKVELTGSKSYYLFNGTEQYYKKLRAAYKDVQNDKNAAYLYFGFFTLCAATLEYSLNFILADYCIEKFRINKYKNYLEEFINLKFKNKLLMTPHIVSGGKYIINEECVAVKHLAELINLRNRLLHNKEYLNEFNLPLNMTEENGTLIVPASKDNIEFALEVKQNSIDSLDKTNALPTERLLGILRSI